MLGIGIDLWMNSGSGSFTGLASSLGINLGNDPTTDTPLFTTFNRGRAPDFQNAFFDQTQSSLSPGIATSFWMGQRAYWSLPLCSTGSNLDNAIAGDYDAAWDNCALAMLAAAPPGTVIPVRIGWEFNLTGQPWNAVSLGAAKYITAYRRCVDRLRARSNRFETCWCANVGAVADNGLDVVDCYAGDDYVDRIGLDIYMIDSDSTSGAGSAIFNFRRDQDRGLTWAATFADLHGKPLDLPENGCSNNAAPTFVQLLCAWIVANVIPRNGYHAWWNRDDGGIACKISTGERPALATQYLAYFANPLIANGDSTVAENTSGSVSLTTDQDSVYTVGWSIVGGAGAGSFSITPPNTLAWGSVAASTKAVTVRAISSGGGVTDKTLNYTFQAPYVFVNQEASDAVARYSTAISEAEKPHIDNFVGALKAGAISGSNIFNKLRCFYFGWGSDRGNAKRDLKGTLYDDVTEVGTISFAAGVGFSFLGTGTLATGIASDQLTPTVLNSASFFSWEMTNVAENNGSIGNGNAISICARSASNTAGGFTYDFGPSLGSSITDSRGLTHANRSDSGHRQLYKNGILIGSDTQGSAAGTITNLSFGAGNAAFPSNRTLGLQGTASTMTANEAKDFFNACRQLGLDYSAFSSGDFAVAT